MEVLPGGGGGLSSAQRAETPKRIEANRKQKAGGLRAYRVVKAGLQNKSRKKTSVFSHAHPLSIKRLGGSHRLLPRTAYFVKDFQVGFVLAHSN